MEINKLLSFVLLQAYQSCHVPARAKLATYINPNVAVL